MYAERGGNRRWRHVVSVLAGSHVQRGMVFGILILGALLAFELFNYTTTDFALTDLLGDVRFLGVRWAMILSLAFCGMDFAGIARLFTPEKGQGAKLEVWYLLGAWFLAATMNAMLTWWGVSLALLNHDSLGNEILTRQQLLSGVPVFVAVLVWVIRILIIGTFTLAGDRLFTQAEETLRSMDAERGLRVRPVPRTVSRTARTIGETEDELDQRPRPVRDPRASAPRPRPTPPVPMVRPAPKPSAAPVNSSGGPTGLRAPVARTSEASGRNGPERH